MKKRILSLIIISALSLTLFAGCGDNSTAQGDTPQNIQEENINSESSKNETSDDTENNDAPSDSQINENQVNDETVEAKFTEVFNYLYNLDYSNEEKAAEAETYIKENFTPEGAKDMINKIITYKGNVSSSELLVTLVKEIENNDERYEKMYKIRYNVNVMIETPSIYSDVFATLVSDKDGNIFVEKINDFEF